MAPVAPSPHRFIISKQRATSPTKKAQTSSRRPLSPDRSRRSYGNGFGGSSQFANAPRFGAGRTPARSSRSKSPPRSSLVDALRKTGHVREDVEESALQAADDEEMLDGEQASALPTTEPLDQCNGYRALPYSPKRRRLGDLQSESAGVTQAVDPICVKPQTPASAHGPAIPRFSATAGTGSDTDARDDISSQLRPAFLRPSLASTGPSEPLPEAFSPHRRGQKFVAGGLAATVQQWVVEAGQAAVQSRRGRAHLRADDFELKFRVINCRGTGPLMATARTTQGNEIQVLLICSASAEARPTTVQAGSLIGVRAPSWDTSVEHTTWRVCIDWRII